MPLQNGKIYKITSNSTDKIYIGSTCQSIETRFSCHKSSYKLFLNGRCNKNTCYELIKLGDTIITLIEEIQYETRKQLYQRERYHIELNKDICINKYIPSRTNKEYMKEYYQAYKSKIIQYNKQRYYDNREKIQEYAKQRYRNLKLLNSD